MKIADLRWTQVAVTLLAPLRRANRVSRDSVWSHDLEVETDAKLVGEIEPRVSSDWLNGVREMRDGLRRPGRGGRS